VARPCEREDGQTGLPRREIQVTQKWNKEKQIRTVKIHYSKSVHINTTGLENELVIQIKTDVRQQICF
jgi:hypothetical protein